MMRRQTYLSLMCATALTAVGGYGAAHAQQAAPAEGDAALGEIIVARQNVAPPMCRPPRWR